MADEWAQYARKPEAAPTDEWSQYARRGGSAPSTPSRGGRGGGASGQAERGDASSPTARFIGGVMDTTVRGIPKAIGTVSRGFAAGIETNPMGPAHQSFMQEDVIPAVNAQVDQASKAKDAWKRGEHVEAVGHGMAAALPVVGPAAAQAGETIGGELEYDKDGHAIAMTREPDVARGIGQGVGLVAGSVPSVVKPVAEGAARFAGKIPVPERLTPEGMYQSSLRPGLSRKNLPKIDAKVQTGLREGIPVSRGGLEDTRATIDNLNNEVASRIQARSAQLGPVIDPADVAQRVDPLRQTFGNQVNPKADLAALDKSAGEFIDKHTTQLPAGTQGPTRPDPMTLSEAQAEKQGTYRQVSKKFGELGSADVEAQKALARGLKEEIASRVPELADLNKREGGLIELQTELEKMVAREGNKNILGLVPATMAHNPFGFLATLMMDNPAIKSRIAIALDRARKANLPGKIGTATAVGTTAGAVGASQEPPRFAKGGIIRKKILGLVGEAGPEEIVPVESLTAAHSTVPESDTSIGAQIDQLANLKRRVVMLPKGTFPHQPPEGMAHYADQLGNRYIFNPNLISKNDIRVAVLRNRLPNILGARHGGMGAPDKSMLRGSPVNVAARDRKGVTVQSTAADKPHIKSAVKQAKKITPPGGRISIEPPQIEIGRRLRA